MRIFAQGGEEVVEVCGEGGGVAAGGVGEVEELEEEVVGHGGGGGGGGEFGLWVFGWVFRCLLCSFWGGGLE